MIGSGGGLMKRLRRHAVGDTVTLYHGTSAERFLQIINDGKLDMSAMTDAAYSQKGHQATATYMVVNPDNKKAEQVVELSYLELSNGQTYKLADEVLARKIREAYDSAYQGASGNPAINKEVAEQALANKTARVGLYKRHGVDSNVVFVATEESATQFARYINDPGNEQVGTLATLDFGVLLRLTLDKDALGPDANDTVPDVAGDESDWRKSLDQIGQCVHYGPIFTDSIASVKFINTTYYNDPYHERGFDFWELRSQATYREQGLRFDVWQDYDRAADAMERLAQHVNEADYDLADPDPYNHMQELEDALVAAGAQAAYDDNGAVAVTNYPLTDYAQLFKQLAGDDPGHIYGWITQEGDITYAWGRQALVDDEESCLEFRTDGNVVHFMGTTEQIDAYLKDAGSNATLVFQGYTLEGYDATPVTGHLSTPRRRLGCQPGQVG